MKPLSRSELEHKAVQFDFKSLDDTGIFEGYASKFGNEDQGQDIVVKGAFTRSLRERGIRGIKMLNEHNHQDPIGRWIELHEDDYGLYAKGKLLLGIDSGAKVHTLLKEGVLDGLSIGFRVVKSSQSRGQDAVRMLEEVDLREISTVMFPMNELSVITSVKADLLPTERDFERWCTQDAAPLGLKMTRSEVRQYLMPGFKSLLKAKQDAGGGVASTPPDADCAPLVDVLRRFNEAIR
jgi:uncharacterized protein